MALPLSRFKDWVLGQLVGFTDMLAIQTQVRSLIGAAAFGVSGVRAWLPMANPVAVTAPGGMVVDIGGADQLVYLPDGGSTSLSKIAYSTGVVAQTISPADPTNPRHDLICLAFANPDVNPHTVNVRSGSTITPTTVYDLDETYGTPLYVQGTAAASPVDPPVPSGYVALARVTVPAAAASITSGDITILLPNLGQIIANFIFNTASGYGLTAGPGISLTPTTDATGHVSSLEISNTGVRHLNALTGDVTLISPDDSISVVVAGNDIQLTIPGDPNAKQFQQSYFPPVNGSPFTQTLSITLPGTAADTWNLHASYGADIASGSGMSISGSVTTVGCGSGFKFLQTTGSSPGGVTVTATVTRGNVNGSGYQECFVFTATKA